MKTKKIPVYINDRECNLHCPCCGGEKFFTPKDMLEPWSRCVSCGTDVQIDRSNGYSALHISAVVETCHNPTGDRYDKKQRGTS